MNLASAAVMRPCRSETDDVLLNYFQFLTVDEVSTLAVLTQVISLHMSDYVYIICILWLIDHLCFYFILLYSLFYFVRVQSIRIHQTK